MTLRERLQHLIRAQIAGSRALATQGAARVLFHAGGKKLLSETSQEAVRVLSEQGATNLLRVLPGVERLAVAATGPALTSAGAAEGTALAIARGGLSKVAGRALAREGVKAAGKQILKGAGKAAGLGFVLDGAVGGAEAIIGYRRGTLSSRQAVAHVGVEAVTGAAASAAGVMAAAGLIAVTGGIAAPAVFVVGAAGAIITKIALVRAIRRRR